MTRYTKITTFEPTLGRLDNASQLADVQSVIEEFRDVFSVDHMVYHWVNSKCGRLGVGRYSGAWLSRYIQQSYIRIDPVILGCFQRFHPVDWKILIGQAKRRGRFRPTRWIMGWVVRGCLFRSVGQKANTLCLRSVITLRMRHGRALSK